MFKLFKAIVSNPGYLVMLIVTVGVITGFTYETTRSHSIDHLDTNMNWAEYKSTVLPEDVGYYCRNYVVRKSCDVLLPTGMITVECDQWRCWIE